MGHIFYVKTVKHIKINLNICYFTKKQHSAGWLVRFKPLICSQLTIKLKQTL